MPRHRRSRLARLQPHLDGLAVQLFDQVLISKQFVKVVDLDVAVDGLFSLVNLDFLAGRRVGILALQYAFELVALCLEIFNVAGRLLPLVHIIELNITSAHLIR